MSTGDLYRIANIGKERRKLTEEIVEIAARQAYAIVCKRATKHYAGTQLERFVPWDDISEEWRNDYKDTIRAALEAVWRL